MPTVVQEFTGNSDSVIRAYQRILEHQRKMEKSLEKLVEKTKAVDTEQQKLERSAAKLGQSLLTPQERHAAKLKEINTLQEKGLISLEQQGKAHRANDEWLKNQVNSQNKGYNYAAQYARLLGYQVASYLSINAAIQAVNASLEHKIELEKKSKDGIVDIANTQRDAYMNLGIKTTPEQLASFDVKAEGLSARYRPAGGLKSVYTDLAYSLSAAQGDTPTAFEAEDAALRFSPHNEEDRRFIGAAVINLMSATGSKDPMENLGLLAAMGETTAIPTWRRIAKNLSSGTVGVHKFGGSAQDAAALVTALTAASKDTMGEESATAAISLATQLEKYVPELDKYEEGLDPTTNRYKRRKVAKATGMKDTFSRIKYLQENPKELERVISQISVEKKQLPAIRDILEGKGVGQKALDTARASINRPLVDMKNDVERFISTIDKSPNQLVGSMDRGNEVTLSQLETSIAGKERAIEGLYNRKDTAAKLASSGVGWWESGPQNWLEWNVDSSGKSNEETSTRMIRRRTTELRGGRFDKPFGYVEPGVDSAKLQQADILENYLKTQTDLAKQLHTEIRLLRQAYEKEKNRPNPVGVQNNLKQHGEGGR